jgi:hypothetical protein
MSNWMNNLVEVAQCAGYLASLRENAVLGGAVVRRPFITLNG